MVARVKHLKTVRPRDLKRIKGNETVRIVQKI